MKVRANLLELHKRKVELSNFEKNKIYINGDNNLYPNEIERVINNSPTAYSCAKLMSKFIAGQVENDYIINQRKGVYISDIIKSASRSIAYQGGVFFHVTYGFDEQTAELKVTNIEVLDYTKCRLEKEDTEENKGRIYYEDFESLKRESREKKWYYPFNSNIEVIKAQIKADADKDTDDITELIPFYRGQIYFLNLQPEYVYPLSPIDSVYNDADSEFRFSLYTNSQMRNGFLGKTAVLTQGLDDEEAEKIHEDIINFLGAEKSDSIYHLDVSQTDDLDNVLKFVQLKAQFDDKLFESTEKRIKRNILSAFNNIPEPLIYADNGALFGTNEGTYIQMKRFYSEQTEEERKAIEKALIHLGFQVKINPLIV